MTELQFTPEYIKFMQSDEAKCLQALWEAKQWDHVWDLETESPGILFSVPTNIVFVNFLGTDSGWLRDINKETVWLPTLYQLLQVIEGAGKRVELILYELDRGTYYGGLAELMMRAAKLAVKAVKAVEEK